MQIWRGAAGACRGRACREVAEGVPGLLEGLCSLHPRCFREGRGGARDHPLPQEEDRGPVLQESGTFCWVTETP